MKTIKLKLNTKKPGNPKSMIPVQAILLGYMAYLGDTAKTIRIKTALMRLRGVPTSASPQRRIPSVDESNKILEDCLWKIVKMRLPVADLVLNTWFRLDSAAPNEKSFTQSAQLTINGWNIHRNSKISIDSFFSDYWTPTKPILHLLLGVQEILLGPNPSSLDTERDPQELVNTVRWITDAIPKAEFRREQLSNLAQLAKMGRWDRRIALSPAEQIRFAPSPIIAPMNGVTFEGKPYELFTDLR